MIGILVNTVLVFILFAIVYAILNSIYNPKRKVLSMIKEKEGVEILDNVKMKHESLRDYLDVGQTNLYMEIYNRNKRALGWKVMIITLLVWLGIGLVLMTLGGELFASQSIKNVVNVFKPTPTIAYPTRTPRPTTSEPPTSALPTPDYLKLVKMSIAGCIEWNSLTEQDRNKERCVYGYIADVQHFPNNPTNPQTPETRTLWIFENTKYPHPPVIAVTSDDDLTKYPIGSCIWVKGTVDFLDYSPIIKGSGYFDLCSNPPRSSLSAMEPTQTPTQTLSSYSIISTLKALSIGGPYYTREPYPTIEPPNTPRSEDNRLDSGKMIK